ncbi:helicase-associated domain-containing protein [Phytohabitans sp. ZYX-F-186]|uniref:Helicase-associated domain-containing protein n=1 Tax=Phytohabitans maris TaxID=3071409 RepID=A0ABU0ZUC4_9ACTN|nr:helicase-associated domain-containing protein [Phytohabitans sp. ZYX-F-186]MDQ7910553.1 helicase-associated domain-containing protein [Phytohabitans sp. ZYX-F-186]
MATTLAEHLRSLPDRALAALLQLRPDLVMPVPADLSALAVRAQSRVSVARALDGLDQFTLQVLDAVRLTREPDDGTTSVDAVLAMAKGETAAVREALARLRALLLVPGPDDALHVVAGVDEVSSPYPAGLGRPAAELDAAAAALCADPARLRRTLLAAPPPARAVLDRLSAGPPVGTLTNGTAAADSPVRWLLDNGLLVRVSGEAMELPREIGLLLRRDSGPLGPLHVRPPAVTSAARELKSVDSAGAGQAMEAVRQAESLLAALDAEPVTMLRSGGLGVRDLRRLAKVTALDEPVAALLLEVAYAAGLVNEAEASGSRVGADLVFLPTAGYDTWRALPLARRWERLATAWLAMTRQAGLIGQRDERDRPINVLATEAERAGAPAARHAVLEVLAELEPGTAPTADEVLALLAWRAPRRAKGRETIHREVLGDAALLGVTGLGALTSYGRVLVTREEAPDDDPLGVRADEEPDLAGALDGLLPAPVDHVLVQADLTVVVPGPPEPALAAELELVAEQESAGGASVHRVTEASVRRALDAGYTADDLHALVRRRSRTPVPQGLTYLVDDVARKHGGLRAGGAGAYVRSDDETLLVQLLADKRLGALALRRLAPTVLVTPYQVGRLLTALREAGYPPVHEDATGAAVLSRARSRRAPVRTALGPRTEPLGPPPLTPPRLAGIVEQIRRGDAAARAARRAPVTVRAANGQGVEGLTAVQAHSQALAVLQQAVRDKALVWVGYVDAHGATVSRLVRPVSIGGGYLRAEDERTEMLHTFALHRITAAVLDD